MRQRFRPTKVESRPVLDLVDFGKRPCVILDIGANCGGFAGNILLRCPLAQVHCFEPNPDVLPRLRENAARYGTLNGSPRCHVRAVGVGSSTDKRELIVTGLRAASSFLAVADAARTGWPDADFEEQRRQLVSIVRIDEYLDQQEVASVKLMKLDVQGFEREALEGCGERLHNIEYIVSEVQFQRLYHSAPLWYEIVDYVRGFGFKPIVMDGFCFAPDGAPLQADILLQRTG